VTALVSALAVLLAAFVKGAIAFGFPTVATPLLALVVDVKTAVAVLILPNLVMDTVQSARRGSFVDTARRLATLLAAGAVGTVLGTRVLVGLPPRAMTLILGAFLIVFAALNVSRVSLRVPAGWERWCSPAVGLLAGVLGGVTNVPSPPLVIYFYALGLPKHDFVRAVALSFMVLKLVQLGAVAHFGLLGWHLLGLSLALTAVALAGFRLGLKVQDRLDQQGFNRVVLAFLVVLGAWLIVRSLA
jgi:uncharacterized membrane protein YfcA